MASGMGGVIVLFSCLLGLASSMVNLQVDFIPHLGWEVKCSWETQPNDFLQSFRLYRNEMQIVNYRPGVKVQGPELSDMRGITITEFRLDDVKGQKGKCVATVELFQNATEERYKCEISGERPKFRLEDDDKVAYVPPSAAEVKVIESKSDRPTLNCTSSGIPPPKLQWTVEEQKQPEDFTHTKWNPATKLWDSWSSYNPQEDNVKIECTPVLVRPSGRMEVGGATQWVYNSGIVGSPKIFILIFSMLALLLR